MNGPNLTKLYIEKEIIIFIRRLIKNLNKI